MLFGYRRTPAHERRFGEKKWSSCSAASAACCRASRTSYLAASASGWALAALLTSPQLLLMDEPLAALDLRRKQEILPIWKSHPQLEILVLYVSHAPDEVAPGWPTIWWVLDQGWCWPAAR